MKRIRSSGDEVTLFPFLAVLICTMGSLIVLLVVVVQQAKATAGRVAHERAVQQADVDAEVEAISTQVEELEWRIQILNASRAETTEAHERKLAELAYLEDEIRQLRDRIVRAAEEADQVARLELSVDEDATDASRELQMLREKIDYAREGLAQARANRANRQPSYALVPYEGASGTRRRPIYVECLSDRIVLQPEGIELLSEDFEEPLTDDNPLAASLRAQREYLKDAAADDHETAYPLLVVRPDGAQSYAAARAAMQSWDTEFGYELIDADMKLAFPERDPALAKVVQSAVEESRLRRQMLRSIAPARFGRS
ncbi:MAG: hypothetical protein KDB23_27345, partial [Planctomycetales bacterium]|nr:hypothetical protein [Planctomycetales bacterium]